MDEMAICETETLPLPTASSQPAVRAARVARFRELDALRGLAACTVILNHIYDLQLPVKQPFIEQLLFRRLFRFLVAGHEAVVLFFVLSGFVLTLPFLKQSNTSYLSFLTKRICRIYLPYLGGLGLAVLGCWLFYNHSIPSLSPWFQMTWSEPLSWKVVLQHVGLIGFFNITHLNTAFWSLVIEMRVSIVFPLLMLLLSGVRTPKAIFFAGSAAFLFGCIELKWHSQSAQSIASTAQYAMSFVIGSLFARSRDLCAATYLGLPFSARSVMCAGILSVWSFAGIISANPAFWGLYNMILSLASVCLILVSMTEPSVKSVLLHRIPQYLGQVSYSVYLIHATVLAASVHLLYGKLPLFSLMLIFLVLTFVLGTIFHSLIEEPCMRLGVSLGERVRLLRLPS